MYVPYMYNKYPTLTIFFHKRVLPRPKFKYKYACAVSSIEYIHNGEQLLTNLSCCFGVVFVFVLYYNTDLLLYRVHTCIHTYIRVHAKKVAVKKQARREADLEAYLMRELAVLKHFQHENLLQYVGASNAASAEPGGERF